jgi:hypothetical protein
MQLETPCPSGASLRDRPYERMQPLTVPFCTTMQLLTRAQSEEVRKAEWQEVEMLPELKKLGCQVHVMKD